MLARAESVARDRTQIREHLRKAQYVTATITDSDAKRLLLVDLETTK